MTTNPSAELSALPSRRKGAACVSDLVLDQLACGDLSDSRIVSVRGHLETCAGCAAAWAHIESDRAAFAREIDVNVMVAAVLARSRPPAPRRRGFPRPFASPFAVPITLSAAAAFALLLLVRPADHLGGGDATTPVTTRGKGGFALRTYVKFKDQDQPGTLHLGQPLSAGDRIAFRVSSDRPGHLAVVAVDDAARVSVYYPPGRHTEPVAAGHDIALSTAVELDTTPGHEVIVGLRCEREIAIADIVDRVNAAVTRATKAGRAVTQLGPLDLPCAETRLVISKAGGRGGMAAPQDPPGPGPR